MTHNTSYVGSNGHIVKVYGFDDSAALNPSAGGIGVQRRPGPGPGISGRNKTGAKDRGTRSGSPVNSRRDGYTRVKVGEHRRRTVTRAPDMSRPNARVRTPAVSLGTLPKDRARAVPVAGVYVEPKVRTISGAKAAAFPFSTIVLSTFCTLLLLIMVYSYVQINEYTLTVSNLQSQLSTLAAEEKELTSSLTKSLDLTEIEKLATEKYGMVKLENISKQYITLEIKDKIEIVDTEDDSGSKSILHKIINAFTEKLK